MEIDITPAFLQPYFQGKKQHCSYKDSCKLYEALRVHADGEFPVKIIHERRPSESDEILAYREKIYEPITKDTFKRILTSLNKIRRSSDWSVRYDSNNFPGSLPEQNQPDKYTEEEFPHHTSITNWLFTILLKNYLVDPNAVVMVKPLSFEVKTSEFLEPFPYVFNSDKVLEYMDGELAILKSDERVQFSYGNGVKYDGDVFYVVTAEYIQRWVQQNAKREFLLESEYPHGLPYMPVFRLWADFYKQFDDSWISESRISSIVPRLNETIREYSDLQAGVVNHLYPEKWEWDSIGCDACKNEMGLSIGKVKQGKSMVTCPKCKGTGANHGPYKKMVIRPTNKNLGEQEAPIPPMGYVTKDVEIIKLQDERVDKHQYAALASINMQFLLNVPLNQSGYAKEVDKDELNHFVYGIAEDMVAFMDKIYQMVIDYRYMLIVPNQEQRSAMLPMIAVPEKYDILSLTYLLDELTKAVTARVSPAIIMNMMKEYISKKYYNNQQLRDVLMLTLDLDPLACIAMDDKMQMKQTGAITEVDYIISANIQQFVNRAMNEEKNFAQQKPEEKRAVMVKYAEEALNTISGKAALEDAATGVV